MVTKIRIVACPLQDNRTEQPVSNVYRGNDILACLRSIWPHPALWHLNLSGL